MFKLSTDILLFFIISGVCKQCSKQTNNIVCFYLDSSDDQ